MSYRDETATLRAEVERLRREVAEHAAGTLRQPSTPWCLGDWLSAPIVIGGLPIGVAAGDIAGHFGGVNAWIPVAVAAVWWLCALHYTSVGGER